MRCERDGCHEVIPDGARFCPGCGTPVAPSTGGPAGAGTGPETSGPHVSPPWPAPRVRGRPSEPASPPVEATVPLAAGAPLGAPGAAAATPPPADPPPSGWPGPTPATPPHPPGRRSSQGAVLVVVVVLAVLAVAVALVVALGRDDGTGRADGPSTSATASTTSGESSTDPSSTSSSSSSSSSSSTTAPLTGAAARAELDRIADADRAVIDGELLDRWQPQLSAKQVGLTDTEGVYYADEGQILEHYRELKARYPTALLVRSSDYSSFENPGYWVVVLGEAFPTPEAANAWCDAADRGPGDCFAKRINDEGTDGNTVHR